MARRADRSVVSAPKAWRSADTRCYSRRNCCSSALFPGLPQRPARRRRHPGWAAAKGSAQLTGDVDWETGRPTAARTFTNFGLDAADLGYPVEHDGKLILLYGDSWPPRHPGGAIGEISPDDAVGMWCARSRPATTANAWNCGFTTIRRRRGSMRRQESPVPRRSSRASSMCHREGSAPVEACSHSSGPTIVPPQSVAAISRPSAGSPCGQSELP
jgi:hypothetical protein